MTTPNEELRKLAEECLDRDPLEEGDVSFPGFSTSWCALQREFIMAANPSTVIALLDELQSQAERIAELERESETHAKAYGLAIVERDNLRHELKTAQEGWRCECSTDDACRFARERDALRAQLAEIEKTEPVLVVEKEPDYWSVGHFHEGSRSYIKPTKVWSLRIGTQLFTRPMPAQLSEMEARKDAAYLERNQLVSLLSKLFPSGIKRTAIEGWSDDWHGCVYIDLPTGQASWHYHDSQAYLFAHLPPYAGEWDGHDTEQKYERIANAMPAQDVTELVDALERESETHAKAYGLAIVERDNLRHELKTAQEGWRCECSTDDACRFARERDALRAQLVAIAATEPVGTVDELVDCYVIEDRKLDKEAKLFTRPMPAQDAEIAAIKSALRTTIRTYVVDDDAWDTARETERFMKRAIDAAIEGAKR